MYPIATFVMQSLEIDDPYVARKLLAERLLTTSKNRDKCFRVTDRLLRHGLVSVHLVKRLPALLSVSEEQLQPVLRDNQEAHKRNYQTEMFTLLGAHIRIQTGDTPIEKLVFPIFFHHKQIIRLPRSILTFPKRQQISAVKQTINQYLQDNPHQTIPYFGKIYCFDYIHSPRDRMRFDIHGELINEYADIKEKVTLVQVGNKQVRIG